MSKWYEVPEDQEQDAILKKREEWFPKAEKIDWVTLKNIFNLVDPKKRNNQILMKEAVNYFPTQNTSEVKKFCDKFNPSIISLSPDKHHIDITYLGFRILFDESFRVLRETKYWFPHLDQILTQNQDDQRTKTEYGEAELFKLLSDIESLKELERQRKLRNQDKPYLVRQPKLESFIISEVADYFPKSKDEILISLRKGFILGVDPQEWYDQFFVDHFHHFDRQLPQTNEILDHPETPIISKKGKIFISCGQYRESEILLGKKLSELINELTPFEGYFAQNDVSLNSLSENIFRELNNCAGLVVVMHARGNIETPDGQTVIRASVWIEQEVAIAAFIQKTQKREIKIILYAERGISLEGVRSQLHLNPVIFENNSEIVFHFKKYLTSSDFDPNPVAVDDKFICPECNEKFDNNENLVNHQTVQNHFDWAKDF
jgi:hypothetical protein